MGCGTEKKLTGERGIHFACVQDIQNACPGDRDLSRLGYLASEMLDAQRLDREMLDQAHAGPSTELWQSRHSRLACDNLARDRSDSSAGQDPLHVGAAHRSEVLGFATAPRHPHAIRPHQIERRMGSSSLRWKRTGFRADVRVPRRDNRPRAPSAQPRETGASHASTTSDGLRGHLTSCLFRTLSARASSHKKTCARCHNCKGLNVL